MEPWDLDFYFSTLTNNFEDALFAPEKGWARARQVALGLGYDLNKLPIEMRVADLSFAGAAYPYPIRQRSEDIGQPVQRDSFLR